MMPYKIDEHIFDKLTPASSWVLGLLITDGNICKTKSGYRIKLALQRQDRDVLEKVKAILAAENKIGDYCISRIAFGKENTYSWSELVIQNYNIATALLNLGLKPRKSLKEVVPKLIFNSKEEEIVRAFVLGAVEGDGSLYFDSWWSRPTVSLVGGCKFVRQIAKLIKKFTGVDSFFFKDKRMGKKAYLGLRISKRGAGEAVLRWLYASSEPHMRMNRKHKKFTEIMNVVDSLNNEPQVKSDPAMRRAGNPSRPPNQIRQQTANGRLRQANSPTLSRKGR